MIIGLGLPISVGNASFSPVRSGLVCWLDPRVTASLTDNAGYAVQIADLSGNGNSAIQASGASQAQIVASGINGKQALLFDGSNDFYNLPSGLHSIGGSAWTAIMVHLPTSASRSERLYCSVNAGTTVHGIASNSTAALARQTSAGSALATRTKTLTPALVIGVRDGSNITCYHNGATATGTSASAANNTLTELKISHDVASTGIFGYMGTFLLYNRALTTSELNAIGNGLKDIWGFAWANI